MPYSKNKKSYVNKSNSIKHFINYDYYNTFIKYFLYEKYKKNSKIE